jgi:hypothetical protein
MYQVLIAYIDGTLVQIKGDGSDIDKDTVDAVSKIFALLRVGHVSLILHQKKLSGR